VWNSADTMIVLYVYGKPLVGIINLFVLEQLSSIYIKETESENKLPLFLQQDGSHISVLASIDML